MKGTLLNKSRPSEPYVVACSCCSVRCGEIVDWGTVEVYVVVGVGTCVSLRTTSGECGLARTFHATRVLLAEERRAAVGCIYLGLVREWRHSFFHPVGGLWS
jgi:hypothetical protein